MWLQECIKPVEIKTVKSKTGSKITIHEDGYYDTSDVSKLYVVAEYTISVESLYIFSNWLLVQNYFEHLDWINESRLLWNTLV